VAVSGHTYHCMVMTMDNTKTWVPATGDIPTFPGLVKQMRDGNVTMELTKVE
jgi:hypothetical protein